MISNSGQNCGDSAPWFQIAECEWGLTGKHKICPIFKYAPSYSRHIRVNGNTKKFPLQEENDRWYECYHTYLSVLSLCNKSAPWNFNLERFFQTFYEQWKNKLHIKKLIYSSMAFYGIPFYHYKVDVWRTSSHDMRLAALAIAGLTLRQDKNVCFLLFTRGRQYL